MVQFNPISANQKLKNQNLFPSLEGSYPYIPPRIFLTNLGVSFCLNFWYMSAAGHVVFAGQISQTPVRSASCLQTCSYPLHWLLSSTPKPSCPSSYSWHVIALAKSKWYFSLEVCLALKANIGCNAVLRNTQGQMLVLLPSSTLQQGQNGS